jgi:large subunit ribosomal protein L13e
MEKTEDTHIQLLPTVKSPSREAQLRKGRGFSLGEIKAAGKTIQMIRTLGIKIDFLRKSVLQSNIELLKELKAPVRKEKKRSPFVRREKKVRVRTKKVKKKKEKPVETAEPLPEKPVEAAKIPKQKVKSTSKKKTIPKVKVEEATIEKEKLAPIVEEEPKEKKKPKKKEKEKLKKEKVKEEEKGTPLTELSGLGNATAKKFKEVGVNNIEDLIKESPEELALIISGVSEERIKKWIDESKELKSMN